MERELIAVTGCDSGIGRSLCGELSGRGYLVAASYLDADPFPGDRHILTRRMDIRSERDIEGFARWVGGLSGRGSGLSALVHNAGVAMGGPVEDTPMAVYREVMEINFFGMVFLTRKLIPALVDSKGRIVIIGSLAGRIAMPFLSPYCASKFAVEGFADSLRREMLPLGVRTVLVEPAAVATPIWNRALEQQVEVSERYRLSVERFREDFIRGGNDGLDTGLAAGMIARIIVKKRPAARYIIAKNRLVPALELCIPDQVMDRLVMRLFGMGRGGRGEGDATADV
jgi:NAD(P)-dependent dehydrogenase (short-subunit alcohol dehydrogenase family)